MQKKLIALAIAAAFSAPAMAEVTMYGSMDGGLRHQVNPGNTTTGTTDTMQMGQWNTARFGFKGTDDLGDGMKAVVILETSLAPGNVGSSSVMTGGTRKSAQTGANSTAWDYNSSNPFGLLFDRQATLGLDSAMGSFTMGWNYTTAFKTVTSFDPLQGKLLAVTGVSAMNTAARAGNMIVSTAFDAVKVTYEHQVANADKAGLAPQGSGTAFGASYAAGDINAAISYTLVQRTPIYMQAADTDDSKTHLALGAGYKMDAIKVSVGYSAKETKAQAMAAGAATTSAAKDSTVFAGATFAMSDKISLAAAYYSQSTTAAGATLSASKGTIVAAATYALSKATTAYFELDSATSKTAAASPVSSTINGIGLGINTSF